MMIRYVCLLSCLLVVSLGQNPRENVNSAEDEPGKQNNRNGFYQNEVVEAKMDLCLFYM